MNERNFNAIAIYLFLFVDVFINAHGYATNNYPIDFVLKILMYLSEEYTFTKCQLISLNLRKGQIVFNMGGVNY